MIFQEPSRSLNPVLPVGCQIVETLRAHEGMTRRRSERRAEELLELVGIPQPRARATRLPASAVRRDVPARDDRDGARVQAPSS